MVANIRAFIREESGATAIEYGLIAALVSVAAVAALQLMGGSLNTMFTAVSGQLDGAVNAVPGGAGDGAGAGAGDGAGAGAGAGDGG